MQRKTRAVTAATVAAIVAAAVVAKRRAEHGDGHRPVISHASTTSRNAKLATVGACAGGTYAVHRARRAFASAERKEELDRAFELQTAEQVAEALGHMKGAMMKLGQMASYLDQGLPEHGARRWPNCRRTRRP
ncbi:MAG: hypothetical protein R2690_06270 [Acidimicrobiales bacterium]